MSRRISMLLAVLILLEMGASANAWAQYETTWVDVNLGANRVARTEYGTSGDVPAVVGTASLGADYVFPQGWAADVSGGYMISPRVGVGGTMAGSRNRDFPRLSLGVANVSDVTDAITQVDRFDMALHLHAMLDLTPDAERFRARVFAGPSYFHVIQETVDSILYSPVLPTSTVAITSFTFSESDAGGWGGHVGGDVSYFLGLHVGLGAFVRVSRGSVELRDFSGPFKVKAGGVQSGAGLRLRF